MTSDKPLVRVIDDDASVREALTYMLEMEGWDVRTYASARDFLRGDEPSRPGVAVLDVRMPGMTGLQLQDELVERHYPHPLVFLSGHGDIGMAVTTVKKGAFNFLQKPVNAPELVAVLTECIEEDARSGTADEKEAQRLAALLTPRERQVIGLLLQGRTNAEIAGRFGVSVRTVEHHREAAYRKLGVKSADRLLRLLGEHAALYR